MTAKKSELPPPPEERSSNGMPTQTEYQKAQGSFQGLPNRQESGQSRPTSPPPPPFKK